jgi:threonine/homoserine/homoserine lactone efflux protein
MLMSALIVGVVLGFFIQAGIGPTNIAAMSKSIRESFHSGLLVGIGGAFMEMIYAGAASLGLSSFFEFPVVKFGFQILGVPLLFYLGFKSLHFKPPVLNNGNNNLKNIKYHSSFFIGASIYLSNPTFLPLWVGIVGIIHSRQILGSTFWENSIFAVGVALGTMLWFYCLLKFFQKWQIFSKPHIVKRISEFSGLALFGFGIYMAYKLIVDISSQAEYLKGLLW